MDIRCLSIDLPEDITRAKWAGDFAYAYARIDRKLAEDIPDGLRDRLTLEKDRLARIRSEYPFTREQALERMQSLVPGFTEEELTECDLSGCTDFIYVDGRRMYFESFDDTLCKTLPLLGARAGRYQTNDDACGHFIDELRREKTASRRIRIRAGLRIKDEAFVPATYTVHLPVPAKAAQTADIRLIGFSHAPFRIAPEDSAQRTVCMKTSLAANEPFWVEYEYTNTVRYFDGWGENEKKVLYPGEKAPCDDDLRELLPHIRFSPYIRELAAKLRGSETDPLLIARNIYDYITTRVRYSYMRAYALYDDLADFCALTGKGDCGVQAVLFIALCRLNGIPARWQSGLTAEPDGAGCHDWTQFYTADYGWLFADTSFGGAGVRRNNEQRRRFYFGNLDAYRMPANRAYQAELDPVKAFMRRDPFDNQIGEIETQTGPVPVDGWERQIEVLRCEKI